MTPETEHIMERRHAAIVNAIDTLVAERDAAKARVAELGAERDTLAAGVLASHENTEGGWMDEDVRPKYDAALKLAKGLRHAEKVACIAARDAEWLEAIAPGNSKAGALAEHFNTPEKYATLAEAGRMLTEEDQMFLHRQRQTIDTLAAGVLAASRMLSCDLSVVNDCGPAFYAAMKLAKEGKQ